MNEFLLYAGIAAFSLLLFYFWFRRQGLAAEKHWLTTQITQSTGSEQQQYVDALAGLNNQVANGRITLLVALIIIPAAFVIDYLWFQQVPIEERVSVQATSNEPPDLATAIEQLEQKLIENPEDLEGQLLYARAMMSTQQYDYAVGAYQKASNLDPTNANILTDLAEAIAFKNNTGSFLGEPETYLTRALTLDPKLQKAMWLQGIVFYEKQQFEAAENQWSELLPLVQNPNIRSTLFKQINQARAALNKTPITDDAGQPGLEYFIVINASDEIKKLELSPNARLFVFAQAVDGPPMPIAAVPVSAPFSWPMSVTLNDSHNLNPERKLSDFGAVKFSAKISQTGNASPADDDIMSNKMVAGKDQTNIQLTLQK